ncbi:N-methylhydantoinase [Mycolicibacterium phlei]|uniref:5-oxoprolinase n=1 Tax=Mycolicibacterium phlei DSM 43239 = CCUG 21000 TaxID=1226750 RepID=A0A5N5VFT9_MYCPH|nr:hydantoinase B/oxoprolinase family protein [Mycolicibacterium phlei]VEG11567.1 N-methylhydantoinase [Mycobacteroides chelonae]AMO63473.1 Acetophenone carboxylase delta subunit [Mycolicibacterium phlei]KAB7759677.1 5-oxoprolinase [Mycolicibacterium phlei DSM 43239 = CCUG 21000]KXW62498.1 hypothetical protein MPHL43070_24625 [Mycolicibacterium phlei DSM 43070]KXW68722.1 5-oxoprolinase [Mycolicibacterium phlei DSM 43239 = CCUG 21000]
MTTELGVAPDPVTQQVLEGAFVAICAEMGDVTIQTGNSSVLVDGRDFSCALLDADCRLVASANFDPSHLSAMAFTTEYAYMDFGRENLRPGDVIVVNDPYRAGGHLPDMCVIRPIFFGEELIGTAIVRAHHIDVGGMAVGGFAGTAVSVYQEGIRIPPVHWFRAGVEQSDVMDLILLNVRFPKDQLGDYRAQLAATLRGEQRVLELCEKFGRDTVTAAMRLTQEHSEQLMRAIIGEIEDGTYRFVDFIEDDGATGRPYRIAVEVTIRGSDAVVDFTGTSPQAPGPINSSYTNTVSACMNAFLQIIGPEVTFNHGCFRPVTLIAPRGSLVNPVAPAPVMGGVAETSLRIIDVVTGALAQSGARAVSAAGYGTTQNLTGGGYDPRQGKDIGFYIFLEGGWGATAWRDGWNCTPNASSNFQDYPVEILEQTLPVEYLGVSLYEGSGGAGTFRGGFGTVRTFRINTGGVVLSALAERHLLRPWGLFGGQPGAPSSIEVKLPGDDDFLPFTERFGTTSPSKFANIELPEGTVLRLRQGGGGGYGDPFERDPEAVRIDVEDGLVSPEDACEQYGVVVEFVDGRPRVDVAATTAVRSLPRTDTTADRYFGVATVTDRYAEADRAAVPADELPVQVRASITRTDELFEAVRAAVAAGELPAEVLDGATSPFGHPTARDFWDEYALRRWLARRGYDVKGRTAGDRGIG